MDIILLALEKRQVCMQRLLVILLVAVSLLIFQRKDACAFKLLNGKLDCKGNVQQTLNLRTHEDVRDVRFSSFRTTFRFEGLYKVVNTSDLDMRFYLLANYYYDEGLDLDTDQRHAIRREGGKDKYRDFRRPRNSEEWLTEFYLDLKYKDLQARIGKQLVSWGETAESRVADVINPLDTKYMVAFPDWEDFKIGLWMVRLYYTPKNFWQDLSFELLLIPFDFEEQRVPPAGSGLFFGGVIMPNRSLQKIFDKQRRDAPNDGKKNLEIGLRIRGYWSIGEGLDWTVSHFYTRLDSPLIADKGGFARLLALQLGLAPNGKIYTYPHYNSTAFTLSTTWEKIGSSIRGECVYNTNRDYQFGTFDIKEKDLITTALTLNRSTMVPYLSDWNRSTAVEVSLTWFQYWLLNHEYDKSTSKSIIWESGTRDPTWTKFSLSLSTGFFFYTLIPGFNFVYDLNGNTTIVAALAYQPGDHWQWMVNYQQINEQGAARYQNQVIFSVRYEFW